MKHIEVVAAIICRDGLVFATQRGYGEWKDWWEFPGGKVEEGESRENALRREIHEELNTEVSVDRFVMTVEYDYPAFHLTMHCYVCHVLSGHLELLGGRGCTLAAGRQSQRCPLAARRPSGSGQSACHTLAGQVNRLFPRKSLVERKSFSNFARCMGMLYPKTNIKMTLI